MDSGLIAHVIAIIAHVIALIFIYEMVKLFR